MKYDYYEIEIPGDVFQGDSMEEQREGICQQAIDEARERAKLYCVPANWSAHIIKGEPGDTIVTVKVRRVRN